MRRFTLMLMPFLAAFALLFGLYHLYLALQLLQNGFAVRGALVAVFGLVGVALAVGIWVTRRRLRTAPPAGTPGAPGEGPLA